MSEWPAVHNQQELTQVPPTPEIALCFVRKIYPTVLQ